MLEKLVFEEILEGDSFADYTADCSGDRSDCCTRVCTRDGDKCAVSEAVWAKFLEVSGGVVQY
ncbi:hypothetical protein FACS189460_4520 [Deltaproteobacteria bacterium]|nr:hypothetical protein FACS189460_4520 [Deltaproteobacteria bacterium]